MGKTQDQHIKDILRQAGYKATRPRVLVLRALQKTQKPLSIVGLHNNVGVTRVDRATVYRTMNDLVQAGIVARVDTGHAHAHFELPQEHHHHLICTSCHKIEDVHACGISQAATKTLRQSNTFASIDTHSLEFFGLCKQCTHSSSA